MDTSSLNLRALNHYYGLQETLSSLEKGKNIIIKTEGKVFLMKYQHFDMEIELYNQFRYNRFTRIVDILLNEQPRPAQEWRRHKLNVFGTHCLEFEYDKEFAIFIPSSKNSDVFITVAKETMEGCVIPDAIVEVITNENLIFRAMNEIVRPNYFIKVIWPFIRGESTVLEPPKIPKKKLFGKHPFVKAHERYSKAACSLDEGSFLYVGSKEEVYLLTVAKDNDGHPCMQGTYTVSGKPLFYFSNNYLGFISRYDAEKPKFEGDGLCNVARYRTYDIAGFGGKPFIFPQMGRGQDCKNSLFTGYPEIITGKISEALEHFFTTDFSEYADIVWRYAELAGSVHLSSGKPNEQPYGRYYY